MASSRKLPVLNALRAFEVAARLESFKLAAEELNVTHSSISRHINNLEAELSLPLFVRMYRQVRLTPQGQAYYEDVRAAFEALENATRKIRSRTTERRMTVGGEHCFLSQWLIPRMKDFREKHPDVVLDLAVIEEETPSSSRRIDAIIHYGKMRDATIKQEYLMSLNLRPLCAPSLLDPNKPLRTPGDLAHYPIIHYASYRLWRRWLELVGAKAVESSRGSIYYDYSLAIDAALAGEGILLGDDLVYDHIIAGRLVVPFSDTDQSDSYYVCTDPTKAPHPRLAEFKTWLAETCAAHVQERSEKLGAPQRAP